MSSRFEITAFRRFALTAAEAKAEATTKEPASTEGSSISIASTSVTVGSLPFAARLVKEKRLREEEEKEDTLARHKTRVRRRRSQEEVVVVVEEDRARRRWRIEEEQAEDGDGDGGRKERRMTYISRERARRLKGPRATSPNSCFFNSEITRAAFRNIYRVRR